jgi:hypothetical protein
LKKQEDVKEGIAWAKFAGLASQWAIALAALLFLGKYLDQKHFFKSKMPLFIWVLPFVFIVVSLVNIIKETNNQSK